MIDSPLFEVEDLRVEFETPEGVVRAVRGASYSVRRGEVVGVVGESGSGKSVTALAAMGLVSGGSVTGGSVRFDGVPLVGMRPSALNRIRGSRVGMVFQDPMNGLNPVFSIGHQISETLRVHGGFSRSAARAEAGRLLEAVGISDPESRLRQYPHELSGGMRQRVMIALAVANGPELIIADEPTTALDVTVQAQVLRLLAGMLDEAGMVFISHDLSVIAQMADRVVVMYAGQVVEEGAVDDVLKAPKHPYTAQLLQAIPSRAKGRLVPIAGQLPSPLQIVQGCSFVSRCALTGGREACSTSAPSLQGPLGHRASCHFADETHKLGVGQR